LETCEDVKSGIDATYSTPDGKTELVVRRDSSRMVVRVETGGFVSVERARDEVERALINEELLDVLLETYRLRRTVKHEMSDDDWEDSMRRHVEVAEQLGVVREMARGLEHRTVVRGQADDERTGKTRTRITLVESEVGATFLDLVTVETAPWEAGRPRLMGGMEPGVKESLDRLVGGLSAEESAELDEARRRKCRT
jgi:hypothetical protein